MNAGIKIMSSKVIKSPTPVLEKQGFTVFLAGPMKGAPKWQRTVPKLAESMGIDDDIRASDYMKYKARSYGVRKVHKTLEGCLTELKEILVSEGKGGLLEEISG